MNSATPRPFIDPSTLNAAVIAAHAPGRFERLLFGFANWYLGLLSRTGLGVRFLSGLQPAGREQPDPDLAPGQRQRDHYFHRTPRPMHNTARRGSWQAGRTSGLVHGMHPRDFTLPDRSPVIGGRSAKRG